MPRAETITDFYVQSIIDGIPSGIFHSDASLRSSQGNGFGGGSNTSKNSKYHRPIQQNAKENWKRNQMFSSTHMNAGHSISSVSVSGAKGNVSGKKIRIDERGTEFIEDESVLNPNNNNKNNSILTFSDSRTKRNKHIKVSNYHFEHCNQDFWSENINAGNSKELFLRKWSYNLTGAKNKTVRFR